MIQFDIPLRPEGSCHGVREGFFAVSILFNFTHERHRRGDLWIELRADFEEVAFHLLVTFTHLPFFMRILAISNGEAPTDPPSVPGAQWLLHNIPGDVIDPPSFFPFYPPTDMTSARKISSCDIGLSLHAKAGGPFINHCFAPHSLLIPQPFIVRKSKKALLQCPPLCTGIG